MKESLDRRAFLQRLSFVGLGMAAVVSGCGSSDEPAAKPQAAKPQAAPDPCGDTSGLTEQDLNIRKSFQYVAQTPEPAKLCTNCQFWVAAPAGQTCGGCQIIKGSINPNGWCSQWVVKQG